MNIRYEVTPIQNTRNPPFCAIFSNKMANFRNSNYYIFAMKYPITKRTSNLCLIRNILPELHTRSPVSII